jgi:hypothetical protein
MASDRSINRYAGLSSDDAATMRQVAFALAAYVRTIQAGDSPYDQYIAGDQASLGAGAQRGLTLFRGKAGCTGCHVGPTLSDEDFHNTGVAWRTGTLTDEGRSAVTKLPAHRGAFKTPTLREVARTAPYMHDGSFATLADVVDFYDRGAAPNPGLDPRVRPLRLTTADKQDLVGFLRFRARSATAGRWPPSSGAQVALAQDDRMMRDVPDAHVCQRPDSERGVAGDPAPVPGRRRQRPEEGDCPTANGLELLDEIRPRSAIGLGRAGRDSRVEARKRTLEVPRKPERARDEQPLAVRQVIHHVADAPLAWLISYERLRLRDAARQDGHVSQLRRQQIADVAVGNLIDVGEVIRRCLRAAGTGRHGSGLLWKVRS